MRLTTLLRRSLFALPLLAFALAAVVPRQALPAFVLVPAADAAGCASAAEPVGALGLARVPGDLGGLGRRLRCAG